MILQIFCTFFVVSWVKKTSKRFSYFVEDKLSKRILADWQNKKL